MKKSACQILKEAKEQNLTREQTRELLKKEGMIVSKIQKLENYQGNWTEDFPHENGNYENVCIRCESHFLGHKRRVVCKKCM